jgi:hypothetical protein
MVIKIGKFTFILMFILALALSVFSQDETVTISQKTANELYQAVAERNQLRKVVEAQDALVASKDVIIKELQNAANTPCTTALKATSDKLFEIHNALTTALPAEKKEWTKTLALVRGQSKAIVRQQCNLKATDWKTVLFQSAPLALILLSKYLK